MFEGIIGREREIRSLHDFVNAISSAPRALLIEGEAGIGKSTLWESAVHDARQMRYRVLVSRPVDPEKRLSFAGLGDILEGLLDETLPQLPDPQRRALEVAMLRADAGGRPPDQRAISLAVVETLRHVARSGPVLVAIDDAHWLDAPSGRALGFATRRLGSDPIGVLLSRRRGEPDSLGLGRLPPEMEIMRMEVGPLDPPSFMRLLRARVSGTFPHRILMRIAEDAGGNPFFGLEIARALALRGVRPAPGEPLPVPHEVSELLKFRLRALPQSARDVLGVVAATGRPTTGLVRAVTGSSTAASEGLVSASDAELIRVADERITFTHPLIGSAMYSWLGADARRTLHRRLADLVPDPEERARHVALGADGPDPAAADVLDGAAALARERGALDIAADLSELARSLTPEPLAVELLRRTVQVATDHFDAGDPTRARALLHEILATSPPGRERALVLFTLGIMAWDNARLVGELLERALSEPDNDPALIATIQANLSWVDIVKGNLKEGARRARAAIKLSEPLGQPFPLRFAIGALAYAESLMGRPVDSLMSRAISLEGKLVPVEGTTPRTLLGMLRMWAGDLDEARLLIMEDHRRYVDQGRETQRWEVLAALAELECRAGNLEQATAYAEEAHDITVEGGVEEPHGQLEYVRALIASLRGRVDEARTIGVRGLELAEVQQDRLSWVQLRSVLGFLELSLGHPKATDDWLSPLPDMLFAMGVREPGAYPFMHDEVEALVALGELRRAIELAGRLDKQGQQLRRPMALAMAARCRGLLTAARNDLGGAMASLDQALELLSRVPQPIELARTLLLLGMIQRRGKQKAAARASLEQAIESFERIGTPLWSQRARAELARVGGQVGPLELTPTEHRVADLVARGHTNREIADALFVSIKTVEANLSRIYRKKGLRSRTELTREMVASDPSGARHGPTGSTG